MAAAGRTGRTVVLRLRFGDYSRATRSRTLPAATADADTIVAAARALLAAARPLIERHGLTLVGVTISDLHHSGQLALVLEGSGA
jgi:DNA polymerase-4